MSDVIQVVRSAPVGPVVVQVRRGPVAVQVIRPDPAPPAVRVSRQGPPGLPGIPGTIGGRVVHNQSVLSSSWLVFHSFGAYPQVEILDDDFNVMDPDIVHSSGSQITVIFAQPTTGYAILS